MNEINTIEQFESKIQPGGINNQRYYSFDGYIFNIEVNIFDANIIKFKNCTFKKKVMLTKGGYSNSIEFQGCRFEEQVLFDNSTFGGKVRIQSTNFINVASFANTRFEDLCDFWGTTFHETTIFYKTDFMKTTVFSTAVFNKNVLFTYTLIDHIAIFRGTEFKAGLDLSSAIINGNLNLFDFKLRDYKAINDDLDEKEYESFISDEGYIPEKNKRETFRIVKRQLESQSNHIVALDYSALELRSHFNELKPKIFKRSNKNQNLFILVLNILSNKNGKSWLRGVGFTLLVAGLFFSLTIISTTNYYASFNFSPVNINKTSKYFFEFLMPTHKNDFLDIEGASSWTYFFDFSGRVFTAFGIYQVVQAFRKYRN
jgi:Pentapeptide repeats (9 copies)